MILTKKDKELSLVFNLKADDFEYTVFVTSGTPKCVGCWREDHLVQACPQREEARGDTQRQTKDGEGTKKTQQRKQNSKAGKDKQKCQKEDEISTNSEKAEGEQTVLNSADRAAQDTVRDSDEDLMVEGDTVFKVPVMSRKHVNENSGSQAKEGPVTRSREGQ